MAERPSIVVVGSVNLDIVASAHKLPVAGETITGAQLQRFPGGKGANQALAARRLGANVSLLACVGDDAHAAEALALLRDGGVDLSMCATSGTTPTGVALICVAPSGENQIVVAPGANRALNVDAVSVPPADAMICQLEVPVDTLCKVIDDFAGFVCINLAPAMDVPAKLLQRADLVIVNETEALHYGDQLTACNGLVAETLGGRGARLSKAGKVIAEAGAPAVKAVDATGAGDAFAAALTVAIAEGQALPGALAFACAAGAAAVTKAGAQPSLPFRHEVEALLDKPAS